MFLCRYLGCNVQNPRNVMKSSISICKISLGVKLWEWNSFLFLCFFVFFLSIAKYDRAVLLVTLKPKKSHTVKAIHLKHYSTQSQIYRHSMGPYDKPVAELKTKATYRMKWASLSPPLAVSTA